VREGDQTVRNWLKRWMAQGIEELKDRPMEGAAAENHGSVEGAIIGVSPASASQPGAPLFDVDIAALVGLHGGANRPPGLL
jgi:hypothetical protein